MPITYSQLLHSPFKMLKGEFKAFLDYFYAAQETIRQEAEDNAENYSITSAATTWLDRFGIDLDCPRQTGEANDDYRERLWLVLRGCGVTKESLEALANLILEPAGYDPARIFEWFEYGEQDRLKPTWFRLDLPTKLKCGIFEGKSFLGYYNTSNNRSVKEAFLQSVVQHWNDMGWEEIKRLMLKYKASGTKCLLTMGDYTVYSPDADDYLYSGATVILPSDFDIAYGCEPMPATDGAETTFEWLDQLSYQVMKYQPNSSKIWMNGLTLTKSSDYTENPLSGVIEMIIVASASDKIRARLAKTGTWTTTDCSPAVLPNGVLTDFTFLDSGAAAITSFVQYSTIVTLNGLTLTRGTDYTETPATGTIVMTTIPQLGDVLRMECLTTGTPRPNNCPPVTAPNGTLRAFNFKDPSGATITSFEPHTSVVYLNGLMLMNEEDYTESHTTGYITLFVAPLTGDILRAELTV